MTLKQTSALRLVVQNPIEHDFNSCKGHENERDADLCEKRNLARVTNVSCAAVNQQQPRCPQRINDHDRQTAHKQLFMNLVRNEGKESSRPQGNRCNRLHEDVVDSASQQKDGCRHGDCGYEKAGRTVGRQLGGDLLKRVAPGREFLVHSLRQILLRS